MKECMFISDFDGTITKKDFYWILLDDYIGEKGIEYYHQWKKDKKIGTEFLNRVFSWHGFSEKERLEAMSKVEIDQNLDKVIEYIHNKLGEFLILSAGFDYYISSALKNRGLEHIPLITNPGSFKNETFIMEPNEKSPFYSPIYGVDKEKVLLHYRKKYKKLYFAGDSEPDFKAALVADVVFAKHELARLLDKTEKEYYPYDDFSDIIKLLELGI